VRVVDPMLADDAFEDRRGVFRFQLADSRPRLRQRRQTTRYRITIYLHGWSGVR
jgi:hypothetical protein